MGNLLSTSFYCTNCGNSDIVYLASPSDQQLGMSQFCNSCGVETLWKIRKCHSPNGSRSGESSSSTKKVRIVVPTTTVRGAPRCLEVEFQ